VIAAGASLTKIEAEPVGSLAVALSHARRLLETRPALAERQALEILAAIPGQPDATLILAVALRKKGEADSASTRLSDLADAHPYWPSVHYELGLARATLGDGAGAEAAFRRATALKPDMSDAWRALGDVHFLAGDAEAADAAYAQQIKTSVSNPVLMEAAGALCDNRLAVAERLLKDFLKRFPTDVAAIRMLAEVAARIGRFADAEALLRRCLELAPGFEPARHNYAIALHRQGKSGEALPEIERLLAGNPGDPGYRNLKAAALSHIGDYPQTIELYAGVLRDHPRQPKVWMSYGHALKTAGRQAEGIDAYRRAIALMPSLGEAYWSLANLKTFRFAEAEIGAMEAQLARLDLSDEDRLHFHFALGKALEDAKDYAGSFAHYAEGNRIRARQLGYRAEETTERLNRSRALFTAAFFHERAGWGCPDPDPIFVVGLPRSGSTLIEQILSSHSAVEGTMELPDLGAIAHALGDRRRGPGEAKYPELLADLGADRVRALGEEYLSRTRIQRKTGRPFFIDKTPQNFIHLGLIRLILPNARIIDVRRHPMATCFSSFKQHFARGQPFSYDLRDLGRYYRDYVATMAHFDDVGPGKVHRVVHETLVDDTENEMRRLLQYCGLPFEEACLRFHENDRAVRTASSEQVRRPIFREGLDQWRHYEPWLDPLRESLGDVLEPRWEATESEVN
jgi:tetratricopeptide (TPR) repeat protein